MKAQVDARMNEAAVCRSMGLFDESLDIYRQILVSLSSEDTETQDSIKAKIEAVKQQISERDPLLR